MQNVDATHVSGLRSWVSSASGHPDFPIQNLPFGIFSPVAGAPRGGVAIGDEILDLRALNEAGLLDGEAQAVCHACAGPTLNPVLALRWSRPVGSPALCVELTLQTETLSN